MSKEILQDIIKDFNPDKFTRFFREKNRSFAPRTEDLPQYDDDNFSNGQKLGEIQFTRDKNPPLSLFDKGVMEGFFDDVKLFICAFEASQPLSERSGKKAQYEKGKRILRDINADAGMFIFYDRNGSFRFSLIYPEYTGTKRQWSYFKRFTYFVSPELTNKTFLQQIGDGDFSSLQKIKEAFSVDPVTKQFYNELQTWYFWAMDKIKFPDDYKYSSDTGKDKEIRNATNLIRLITRIIFIWFLMEKGLVPPDLFSREKLSRTVKDFMNSRKASNFYNAILQNLFFGTLNQKMNERKFAEEMGYPANKKEYGVKNLYRYADKFLISKNEVLKLFEEIPFLNGGLFDCLDKEDESGKVIYIDGFSRNPAKQTNVPDYLFFQQAEEKADLSVYGLGSNRTIRGLIEILQSYNFTIDENTPVDQEIALDPELLGKVFENLLASYNPETATTARKATGSYYTPREIVDYMVTESLVAYLKNSPSKKGCQEFPSERGVDAGSGRGVSDGVVKWYELPYNPKLKERACELRKAGNLSEVLFWEQVKSKKFLGLDFDRQKIIGDYIVDFYCKDIGLIIEIDGSSHNDKIEYDIKRDKFFESLGLKVIHILDKDIKINIEGVMQFLEEEVNNMRGEHPAPLEHTSIRGQHPVPLGHPSMRGETHPSFPSERGVDAGSGRGVSDGGVGQRLRQLLSYSDEIPEFPDDEKQKIISAIDDIKILDPACGSGAFPMGILHKLVYALQKLDPDNKHWHELQYQKALKETEETFKLGDKNQRQERLKEINEAFDEGINYPDYARKLYLIENCIYGVDIQPIAIQISKLRFFISLVLDQKVDRIKENLGIRALPNLETKFVAANTLIGLEMPTEDLFSGNDPIKLLQNKLENVRHLYFSAKKRSEKIEYQNKDKQLRKELAEKVKEYLTDKKQDEINQIKKSIKEEELKLQKVTQEPEDIAIIEQTTLLEEINQIKIDKKKKIKEIKSNLNEHEKKLRSIQKQVEGDFVIKIAEKIAAFDLYDQNASADFFDPEWMFGIKNPSPHAGEGKGKGEEGFDVVIGNPPYGADYPIEHKKYFQAHYESAKTISGKQKGSLDTFSLFIDKGLILANNQSVLSYIVPMAIASSEAMTSLHNMIFRMCDTIYVSTYSDRPNKIFDSAEQSVAIIICQKNNRPIKNLFTTKVNKRYENTSVQEVIDNLHYINSLPFVKYGRIPKVGSDIELSILQKIYKSKTTLADLYDTNGKPVYYRSSGGRYYKIVTNFTTGSTKEKSILVKSEYRDLIAAILSSNLYFWFYHIYSNNLDLKSYELAIFPIAIESFSKKDISNIEALYEMYLKDLHKNSKVKKVSYAHVSEYREYYARYSKSIIDEIDLAIKDAYGLTDEEIQFIINYDLKFRTDNEEE